MSHFKLRKEKDCLNCGLEVMGRYCHKCGQENIEPRETFLGLVTHFIYDITHFDGKFFITLKALLLKPGLLSLEYNKGRRVRYVNPIKLYVFISAVFFFIFFNYTQNDFTLTNSNKKETNASNIIKEIEKEKKDISKKLQDTNITSKQKTELQENLQLLNDDLQILKTDTTHLEKLNFANNSLILDLPYPELNAQVYDSLQQKLADSARDNWFTRQLYKRAYLVKDKYKNNNTSLAQKYSDLFLHSFPQILFLSLPLFSFFLFVLYARQKKYFYVEHVVYTIHLYCATFIQMLIIVLISVLINKTQLQVLQNLKYAVVIYCVWYFYSSLKCFYQQSKGRTLVKNILMYILSLIMLMVLFIFFALLIIFRV